MSLTIDLIIRIKNGYSAGKKIVICPFSKLNKEILEVLKKENYIKDFKIQKDTGKKQIKIELLYEERTPKIKSVSIVSRPGRRLYSGVKDLKPYLGGSGKTILVTTKGVLTDKEAREKRIGGEILFKIW